MQQSKNKKTKTASEQNEETAGPGQIICRIDKLELRLENNKNNHDKLDSPKKFAKVIKTLTKNFSNGNCSGPIYIGHGPHSKKNPVYNFDEGTTRLRIIINSGLYDSFLAEKCLLSSQEMRRRNFNFVWLARIEIINPKKTLYMPHNENTNKAIQLLEEKEGLDLTIGIMEIALDTRDEQAGNFIKKYTCLKRPPSYSQVFHSLEDKEDSTTYPGPSPDGNNEYQGYRPKGRNSGHGRPEGGRKQLFSYMREAEDGTHFQRVELRLYRKMAIKLKQNYGPTVLNVLGNIEKILRDCIWFRKIDIDQLYKKAPQAKFLLLKNIATTKGQMRRLKEARIDKLVITNCNKELQFPKISYPPYPL